jgi:hypothetical protein
MYSIDNGAKLINLQRVEIIKDSYYNNFNSGYSKNYDNYMSKIQFR